MKKIILTSIIVAGIILNSCANNNPSNGGQVTQTSETSQINVGDDALVVPTTTEELTELTEENIMNNTNQNKEVGSLVPMFKAQSDYYKLADKAQDDLIKNYWSEDRELFWDKYPQKKSSVLNYWWQAHAADALIDAYIRTGDDKYRVYADKNISKVFSKNGKITNDYYDDMEWMALAALRLYHEAVERGVEESITKKYFAWAEDLWFDIAKGWNDNCGGGIAWRKSQLDYKNTPANAPAAILTARLYGETNNQIYLDWSKKIFKFTDENLVNQESGQVWDGMNREGNVKIDKDWCFTYCHGVYIGAAVELYKLTGEQEYLDKAIKTAQFSLKEFTKLGFFNDGIDGGEGDGGLFKGILIRYLVELYKVTAVNEKNEYGIEAEDTVSREIAEKIFESMDVLWENGTSEDGRYGKIWNKAPKENQGYDLTVQLSGVMLHEAAANIEAMR